MIKRFPWLSIFSFTCGAMLFILSNDWLNMFFGIFAMTVGVIVFRVIEVNFLEYNYLKEGAQHD